MNGKRIQKKTEWTEDDKERRRKVRELFKDKPTYEQLVASGELSGQPVPLGVYLEAQDILHALKKAREAAGLSVADVAERTGMDRAVVSRLENGHQGNPTFATLVRYAKAVGKRVALSLVDEEPVRGV